ncbi:MAG: hypothetical protein HY900_37205 [Deltaproteobacteria bacterium]|nr:hypothetical protein [Deltaproteobacteria bacterium]
MSCAKCGAALPAGEVSRRAECPSCGADLHACVQCEFYAPGAYNDCREPQAERVVDKERANFCDYFRPSSRGGKASTKEDVRAKLDALFKKKA